MEIFMKCQKFIFLFGFVLIYGQNEELKPVCSNLKSKYTVCVSKKTEDCGTGLNDLLSCLCSDVSSNSNAFRCCYATEAGKIMGEGRYPCVKCVSYKPARDVFKNTHLPDPDYPIKTYTFRSACEGGCLEGETDEGFHLRPSPCLRPGRFIIEERNKGSWGETKSSAENVENIITIEDELASR
jgi:hypothetical protein